MINHKLQRMKTACLPCVCVCVRVCDFLSTFVLLAVCLCDLVPLPLIEYDVYHRLQSCRLHPCRLLLKMLWFLCLSGPCHPWWNPSGRIYPGTEKQNGCVSQNANVLCAARSFVFWVYACVCVCICVYLTWAPPPLWSRCCRRPAPWRPSSHRQRTWPSDPPSRKTSYGQRNQQLHTHTHKMLTSDAPLDTYWHLIKCLLWLKGSSDVGITKTPKIVGTCIRINTSSQWRHVMKLL